MSELSSSQAEGWHDGRERYAACDDEGVYRFRRGYGGRISGRMRLASLKTGNYKLNNNNTVAVAA